MSATSYRPEIDGLRAIAILTVVFYHVSLGCPGGYIGVDVFFVISGYLISSLILRDLREGTFSLAGFWERRIRRIFPALAACVLATLVAAWFLLLPDDLVNLGKSAVAQALLCANFYFWRTTNYFGGANEEKQLLHTWSLAVEEQFYLFFPLLLLAIFRFPALRRPRTLVTLVLFGLLVSLSIAAWGVKHQPYATFFLLPTRAWELLCGVLVAVVPASAFPASRLTRESASWLGLAGILVPVWAYGETTPFPGLAALPPCLGTALVIWATGQRPETRGQRPETRDQRPEARDQRPETRGQRPEARDQRSEVRGQERAPQAFHTPLLTDNRQWTTDNRQLFSTTLLSARPLVFIGLISYSLYLWHWPLIAFCSYWKTAPFSPSVRWTLVGISVILAALSWRYVETPFRKRTIGRKRTTLFRLAAATSAVLLCAGACFVGFNGIPARLPREARAILDAAMDRQTRRKLNLSAAQPFRIGDLATDALPKFGSENPAAPVQFLVWGDSHAKVSLPAFDALGRKLGVSGRSAVIYSTPPLITESKFKYGAEAPMAMAQAVLDYVQRNRIPNTVLVAYWGLYQKAFGDKQLGTAINETILQLQKRGTKVWIVMDVPSHEVDVPKYLIRRHLFGFSNWDVSVCTTDDHRTKNAAIYQLSSLPSAATFLDPAPMLLDQVSQRYKITQQDIPLYYDNNHLTEKGAIFALFPVLEGAFPNGLKPVSLNPP